MPASEETLRDLARAKKAWQNSRATTAFSYAVYMELRVTEAIEQDGVDSAAHKLRKLEALAAINSYKAICSEVGVAPYLFSSDIPGRQ